MATLAETLYGLGDKGQKVIGQTYKIDDRGNYLYYGGVPNNPYGPPIDQWKADLQRQALDKNRDALSRGDLSTWNVYKSATAPQIGSSGMPLLSTMTPESVSTEKVWLPDANDPAAKFFTPEALKALYLQGGGGSDGGYGKINVGSLDQYLGSGAKDYLMSQGIEGADDDKHKITFYDPTKPYWGANAFKQKSQGRQWGEALAKGVGTAAAMLGGGYLIAGAAGGPGAAGAVGATEGAGTAGGLGLSEMSTALPAMEAMPNFGAVVSPYAGTAAAGAGAGGLSGNATGLGTDQIVNGGWADMLTQPAGTGGTVNSAGGGLEGVISNASGPSSGWSLSDLKDIYDKYSNVKKGYDALTGGNNNQSFAPTNNGGSGMNLNDLLKLGTSLYASQDDSYYNKLKDLATTVSNKADPFGDYRKGYADKLAASYTPEGQQSLYDTYYGAIDKNFYNELAAQDAAAGRGTDAYKRGLARESAYQSWLTKYRNQLGGFAGANANPGGASTAYSSIMAPALNYQQNSKYSPLYALSGLLGSGQGGSGANGSWTLEDLWNTGTKAWDIGSNVWDKATNWLENSDWSSIFS